MNFPKLDKKYVSEIDQFLAEFDKTHPKLSASQVREIQKAARITRLMKSGTAPAQPEKPEIWEEF